MNRRLVRWKLLPLGTLVAISAITVSTAFPLRAADDGELREARERGLVGVRTANCLIKIHGVEYSRGFCTFIPDEKKKDGSFALVGDHNKRFLDVHVVLSALGSKDGVASWKSPDGGARAPFVEIGQVHSEGACWRAGEANSADETRICASSTLAVDQPTPKEPAQDSKDVVYYGTRAGMYNMIVSRSGLDTNHARIVTKKSREAAIIFCRGYNRDFTAECVLQTLRDVPTPVLSANCPAGTFSSPTATSDCDSSNSCELKFLGRNPHKDQPPDFWIQYHNGGVMDGSGASTYDVAVDAFRLLCPKTLKNSGLAKQ